MTKKTVTPANLRQVQRRLDRLEHKTRKKEVPDKLGVRLQRHEKAIRLLKQRIDQLELRPDFTTVPPAE